MNKKKGFLAIFVTATLLFLSQGCYWGHHGGDWGHGNGHHRYYHHDRGHHWGR